MTNLDKRLAALSPEKLAILARRLGKKESDAAGEPLMPLPHDGQLIPLSFAQQRLWFLDQFEPGSAFYNIPTSFRMRGPYNLAALEQSLNEIVRRHEALRTTFGVVNGEPVQVIMPELKVAMPVVDLSDVPESQREAEAWRLAREEGAQPFDLSRGPLFRIKLLRLADDDHIVLLTMHHIISDAWSLKVFMRELSALYGAYSAGRPSPLTELPIQYADFAHWQRQLLRGERMERHVAYWKEHLSGAPALLELPTDRPRPPVQVFRGSSFTFQLPPALGVGLHALRKQEGATLFMMLLAAFNVLLSRYSGQRDLVVGAPIANRTRSELEGLIGFFTNTLALRTHLEGDPTFRELLKRVREMTLGAYAHQDLPFEKLVEELQPERNLGYNPIFQVMFVLHSTTSGSEQMEGPPPTGSGTAKFDLTLFMSETPQGLAGTMEYNTDLFEPSTIMRMAGHFQALLEGIVAQPDRHISELPIMSEAERQHILVQWNQTAAEFPRDRCVHQIFEEQVERTPDAVALRFEGEKLTYRQLNQRANHLAHHLIARGVQPETLVGLCIERSIDMMVGLLGILKAGGAYVPLDPAYPRERLDFMMTDTSMPVIVTQERLVAALPPHSAQLVPLDTLREALAAERDENPRPGVTPGHLTYVIYTSGSTGRPKGVAMGHRALAKLIDWQVPNLVRPLGSRTLQFNSLNFDVSFQEIFSTWCSGGELVVITEEERKDPEALWRRILEEQVERAFIPYVVLRQLAEVSATTAAPVSLREIMSSGEQLQMTALIARLATKHPDFVLRNHYGPTESHAATEFNLTGAPSTWPALPPIGRPIANTQVYVLDPHLNPVPIGVTGDFYIGGEGLARGYLHRPDLTAERFIPNPFSSTPGARLYRTGDLARYRADGQIEFLGRSDDQVKIRGFRIELDELSSALLLHAAVSEAVVVAREDTPGDKRLVAYVVPKPEHPLSPGELRSFLREKLPEYMVPSAFVLLPALPLSPNGKVNRRMLPPPGDARPDLDEHYVAPRTSVEETLARIWMEILGVKRVGIHDNFFELGGHSLLATRVISQIRQVFQVELPLRKLFEASTVAELATALGEAKDKGSDTLQPGITRRSRDAHRMKRSALK